MLDLRQSAKLARERIRSRLSSAETQKNGLPRSAAIIQQGASFRAHLIESLRRSGDERKAPSPAPEMLYLAFPEKLLGKWCYLAYGTQRGVKAQKDADDISTDPVWQSWYGYSNESRITNFSRSEIRHVLLAHGLSAIEDSILLLADIGRAFRSSRALGVPISVLLADVSWINYNRSLKRFDLTDEQVENGLRQCQAQRQRLYEGVNASVRVHAIVPYSKKGAISAQKIQQVSSHYIALAAALWGEDKTTGTSPLTNSDVAMIGRPLSSSLNESSPLQILATFPGALASLESALGKHLNVLRTIAQRFRLLTADTFSYYFAQYYAQDEYRGHVVKIAPSTERDFDEPYDDLDESFRLWGDGHDPQVSHPGSCSRRKRRMAAVYLPQYSLGDWNLLPYTPLSLSAVARSGGQIADVRDRVILLSDKTTSHADKVEGILRNTLVRAGVTQLNRLAYDVLSFIQLVCAARGRATIDSGCRRLGMNLELTLAAIDTSLPGSFSVECEETADLGGLWLSWLDSIEVDGNMVYRPTHITLAALTTTDWVEKAIKAEASLILLANVLANDLSA